MTAAIKVENLSKSYLVGHKDAERARYTALRDVLARQAKSLVQKTADVLRGRQLVAGDTVEEFWALKDINFEVQQGEVLGIIGRNGAGKSTLLKLLSRITEPSTGRIVLNGRVASLLEVGTGFHPELTGRENIFLNGAILGMVRSEIRKRFDEIVAFAEVEKFLDTPVKYYSSGMYVRLAFGVAAHLESEILIVDEVLAVGDTEFQKKCLGKMQDVASQGGRTVLFVSHNLAAVQSLCNRAMLLESGRCNAFGPTESVLAAYFATIDHSEIIQLRDRIDRAGSGLARFDSVVIESNDGAVKSFRCGAPAIIRFAVNNQADRELTNFHLSVGVDNDMGQRVALLDSEMTGTSIARLVPGYQDVSIVIPRMTLLPGRYSLTLYAAVNGVVSDWVKNACTIDIEEGDYFSSGRLPPQGQALFLMDHCFRYFGTRT